MLLSRYGGDRRAHIGEHPFRLLEGFMVGFTVMHVDGMYFLGGGHIVSVEELTGLSLRSQRLMSYMRNARPSTRASRSATALASWPDIQSCRQGGPGPIIPGRQGRPQPIESPNNRLGFCRCLIRPTKGLVSGAPIETGRNAAAPMIDLSPRLRLWRGGIRTAIFAFKRKGRGEPSLLVLEGQVKE